MTRRFGVRPLAEADLEDAARWYDEERVGLAQRFLNDPIGPSRVPVHAAIGRLTGRIVAMPDLGSD
jgi:hypothetical protein